MPGTSVPAALAHGLLAGLALALPFGALGALLLDTCLRSTRRVALSAATGVALTDFLFALLAGLTGAALSAALSPWAGHVRLASSAMVLAVGLAALRAARSGRRQPRPPDASGSAAAGMLATARARRTLLRFALLTAANPLTALTLTAMTAGLGGPGPVVALGFAVGCAAVSATWHGAMAVAAQAVGSRLSPARLSLVAYAGATLTIAMAARLAVVG